MSHGPGRFQQLVLSQLALYRRLESDGALQWTWHAGSRYALGNIYVEHGDIERFERGQYVPMWMLRRDLGCGRADLSRALHSLDRRGFVIRFTGALDFVGGHFGRSCKFTRITDQGVDWLKCQQRHMAKVGAYITERGA